MSAEYKNQDPLDLAKQAERELNSKAAKQGHELSDSAKGAHGASDSSASFLPFFHSILSPAL